MGPVAAVVATETLQVKELTLLVADNTTGYFGVYLDNPSKPKPNLVRVTRGGKMVHLGSFATAAEAALCVASAAVAKLPRCTILPPRVTRTRLGLGLLGLSRYTPK